MPTDKDLWKYGSNITTFPRPRVLPWDHTDIKMWILIRLCLKMKEKQKTGIECVL